ncbi:CHAT domain-containing protein [Annulohypoxylon maeteangense]|uniref:CHAT domain-containing protein n=1 Tax=Annulohypoxylon maeteangense TaxID=1927788 RepID=UPI002007F313|nr:CHAT domain-containing protein [Annulohypoxylon maeteangense]KAI0887517.1 CHAT domain-containing protein [Annulohypoxylon maeteangense]
MAPTPEEEAVRSTNESNDRRVEIEAPRPSQPQTPVDELGMAGKDGWMGLFDIDEEIASSLRGMSDEELRSFSLTYEDSACDKHIELQIYTCFLVFLRTGSPEHFQQAIQLTRKWNETLTIDHSDRTRRHQIGDMMVAWELQLNLFLEDKLSSREENGRVSTSDESDEPFYRAVILRHAYKQTGNVDDLREAIRITEEIVNKSPMSTALGNLAALLVELYQRTGLGDDLNRAFEVANTAVDLVPEGHPDQNSCLGNLAALLPIRFKQLGSVDDLNRAIEITETLVKTVHQNHPSRSIYLTNLGSCLGWRYELENSLNDLNRAIEVAIMAVNAMPRDYSDQAVGLNTLGELIGQRFLRTGSVDDLNNAIDKFSKAVDTTPEGNPFRVGYMRNLGLWIGRRFRREHSLDDLNRAIDLVNMAENAIPREHPDRPNILITLGAFLGWRCLRTGSTDDLTRAIDAAGKAVDFTPDENPIRACCLNNLASLLGERFMRMGEIDDLNRAIDTADLAIQITNKNIARASRLHNLGELLAFRFKKTGSADDLNRAIDVGNMAVDIMPQDHPERSNFLIDLGTYLCWRSQNTGSADDMNHALSYFKEGWSCHTASPSMRISLADRAAEILCLQSKWGEAGQLLREAVNLLPTVSPRSLKHTDKQDTLSKFAGLASTAAAVSLYEAEDEEGAYHALKLLELGRGIIASVLMDMRVDVSDLKQKYPTLAREFISIRDELDDPVDKLASLNLSDDATFWESHVKSRREADQRFGELIKTIRAKPEFHNFLLPPTRDELIAAADPDPIIIVNLSSYRCDAFIIEHNRVRVLKLCNLTLEEVRKRVRDLRSSRFANMMPTLKWLWEVVCRPCLDALGFQEPTSTEDCPHIWWIPTGLLSQLPLHAAGCHLEKSTDTVLDRVVSSYASSIKTLVHGRRHHLDNPAQLLSNQALLVAMHTTPGLSGNGALRFAGEEVSMLKGLCPSLQLMPTSPTLRKEDILESLSGCKIFHFAGHGRSNPMEPSQSALLLEDWQTNPLTVGDLRDRRLQESPPFLGYLSACSTGSNEAEDLADEAIHLIGALQLAGFRHVVGTLWEVSDEHCVHVARVLYETLRDEGMTDTSVSRGLHRAVKQLRDVEIKREVQGRHASLVDSKMETGGYTGFFWVPYVHFGV